MKPVISQWIVDQRKARGWKAEDVARRLREAGYDAEDTTYRTWEASRRPKPETIRGLEQLFGSPAPREEAPTADIAALVAALTEQAASNRALAESVARLAAAVSGQTRQVSEAAADGMTASVHVAIQSALDTVLSRLPAPPDTQETPRQTQEAARR